MKHLNFENRGNIVLIITVTVDALGLLGHAEHLISQKYMLEEVRGSYSNMNKELVGVHYIMVYFVFITNVEFES